MPASWKNLAASPFFPLLGLLTVGAVCAAAYLLLREPAAPEAAAAPDRAYTYEEKEDILESLSFTPDVPENGAGMGDNEENENEALLREVTESGPDTAGGLSEEEKMRILESL